jgi:tryptophan halogenase
MVSHSDPETAASPPEIRSVLVLGGGSAGLLAALTLKRLHPGLEVSLVYSTEIGVIGVGEGTTAVFPGHLFDTLGISKEEFYREAQPTWKQGIRFLWGPRDEFFYDFEFQYDRQFEGLPKATGYYAGEDCRDLSQAGALIGRDKAFTTGPLGKPLIKGQYAFHI